jgi:hypothetical protein
MNCGKFSEVRNVICLVTKYDVKKVIPLLMTIFDWLNPTC